MSSRPGSGPAGRFELSMAGGGLKRAGWGATVSVQGVQQ